MIALCASFAVAPAAVATPGDITTVAGTGTAGFSGDGGPATSAQINAPWRVAVDGSGNLYIADPDNHRVRKVDGSGTITTVAGNGTPGFSGDGGPATSAQLNKPIGLVLDASGNLYIADALNRRVRKVDGSGTITTVAGTGISGFSGDGGPATSAQLSILGGLALDASGSLYIADEGNARVRKVDGSGTITTVAGNGVFGFSGDGGPATSAQLKNPTGVAVDGTGILYIADSENHRVRKVDGSGTITTVAGTGTAGFSGDGGPATSAQLNQLREVEIDGSGDLLIADTSNNRVREVDGSGTITTVAGTGISGFSGDGGPATSAQMNQPFDAVLDGSGNLYIADIGNYRVRMVEGASDTTPPETTIDSGPSGTTNDPTPTFTFSADEPATFECSIDSGAPSFGACSGSGTHTPGSDLADGSYTFRVRATDSALNVDATPATRSFTVDRVEGPPPTYGETADAEPVSGTVRFKPPGSDEFQTLTGGEQIPVGTIIDTRQGRVRLTAAKGPGDDQTQTAEFYDGLFQILQPDETPPVTELKLLGFSLSDCTGVSAQARAERRRRGLWGAGRGRFRVRGRHGAASIRGTTWFTQDRCDGTYFEVSEGSVTVGDFTRDRTVILEVGQSYLAPALTSVEAGDGFTCGVQYRATLACWGDDAFGQASPPGGAFSAVSAGGDHACGVRMNDTLACWGRNGFGQANEPAGTFRAVSAGGDHACGLRTNGTVACWGRDGSGQATPPGGAFSAVSAGGFHTCGIRTNGAVACWGKGNANPPPGTLKAVSAGGFHTCGIRTNGTLACWGQNAFGRANPPPGAFSTVSSGGTHTCGVRPSGALACWGDNTLGQATPPAGAFTAVSAGSTHTCGMRANGTVACWGDGNSAE